MLLAYVTSVYNILRISIRQFDKLSEGMHYITYVQTLMQLD